jgi:Fe-S oxidoreductase
VLARRPSLSGSPACAPRGGFSPRTHRSTKGIGGMSAPVSGGREGSLEAPTRHPIDWKNPAFYDEAALDKELTRVFDICHGCRRCFSLCNSFPTLFDAIDASSTGELDGVDKKVYWEVVDHCYLCDMCFMSKCPYVPPHPWNIDFPHLMLRAKAVHTKKEGIGFRNKLLASTDTVGAIAGIPVVVEVVNAVNASAVGRKLLDATLGVHPEAPIPKYHSNTARKRLKDLIGTSADDSKGESSVRSTSADAAGNGAAPRSAGNGAADESVSAGADDTSAAAGATGTAESGAAVANASVPKRAPMSARAAVMAEMAALEAGEAEPSAPAPKPAAPVAPPRKETAAEKLARLEAASAGESAREAAAVTAASAPAAVANAAAAKGDSAAKAANGSAGAVRPTTGRVAIFTTCYGNRNEPDLDVDLVKILQHNGIEVRLVAKEECCGMPKLELGDLESVARHKEANIPQLRKVIDDGYDILAPIPSCVLMFKQELPLMFPDDPDVRKVQSRIFDPFEYLMLRHRAGLLKTDFKQSLGKVSYHVPCHLRVQNIGLKTRDLLKLVPDTTVDVIERCSGHNGTYAVKKEFRAASVKIGRPVMTRVESAQPAYYTSDCPMAGHQIESGMKDAKEPTHPLKLLRIAYGL